MDNLIYIDTYFNGEKNEAAKQAFESRILNDAAFAEDVAFYVATHGVIKEQLLEEKKKRFREMYEQQKETPVVKMPVRKWWRYVAAASILFAVALLTWVFTNQKNPQQLAAGYIQQNFTTLPVTMGSKQDSLQTGLSLFNQNKLPAALQQFEAILKNDSTNDAAKKYAGIVCLRLGDYGRALKYFTSLELQAGLYSNSGKLYHALTLMKRKEGDDLTVAKILLKQVIEQNLEGKEDAARLLDKL